MSGDRRLIGEEGQDKDITALWKRLAARELEKTEKFLDLEGVLRSRPFMCRKCYRAYNNLMRDTKVVSIACMSCYSVDIKIVF